MVYSFYDFQKTEYKTKSTWEHDQIKDIVYRDKVKLKPSFGRVFNYNYNLTPQFLAVNLRRLKNKDDHLTIEVCGLQGAGKSRLAQRLATLLGFTTGSVHIVFNIEEALKVASTSESGDLIIIDDQRELAGTGSQREALELKALIETIRQFGLSIFLLSPSPKNIDTSLHYRLEVMQISRELRLTKAAIVHEGTYAGYLVVDIPPDDQDELYKEYLPRKEAFVREDALNREKNIRIDYKEMAQKVPRHIKYHKYLPRGTIEYIIREQNPRLTSEEVRNVTHAFGIYIGFNKKTEEEKDKEKPKKESKWHLFKCNICKEKLNTYRQRPPQRCPKCGSRKFKPEYLGIVTDVNL